MGVSYTPNLKLLASTVAEMSRGPKIFGVLSQPRPPPLLVLKVLSCKLHPKPNLYPKFEVTSFTGCRNKQKVPNFLDAPLAQTPTKFGPKSFFLISYTPNPSCILNLKLLASMVTEIIQIYCKHYKQCTSHYTVLTRLPALRRVCHSVLLGCLSSFLVHLARFV